MKKITISLLSLLISAFLVAQPRNAKAQEVTSQYLHWEYIEKGAILDSAKLRIVYSLDYMPDSLKPEQILKDRKILLIGDKLGYFYSYYIYLGDSAYTTGSNQPIFPAGLQGEGARIYTSSAAKERTVIEPITMLSTYRYQENIEEFQWNISTDTCTILSYPCQKATAHFRGRDWTVWFTMDIPIDAGPWKLCGLPGLIMKASDERGHYVYECIGIEQLAQKKEPIMTRRINYTDCTRKEYMKAQKQFYESYVNALLALGCSVVIKDDNDKEIEFLKTPNTKNEEKGFMIMKNVHVSDKYRKIPYNPIELE